ncbi:P-loop containing nucleoside triphosphate hydrolase protein [Choiromyces venosus 120613-1]|uniref:P-loop containing nucleoside triphosphate hydrolase protein n=1 Tax=Choiromyces venosus 120613-1 TaxID=1336337 RepID=A0A3N4K952_9PEZI|nr:P-loop containing nucleoside triphosphate hydrolase protein [Choiromyces venosus 120613-1]
MASQYARNPRQGSQSPSALASRIVNDNDSGYGSVVESEGDHPAVVVMNPGQATDADRRLWASHVSQLHYNQNRVALGRSITSVVDTLKKFQQNNSKWPAHYPSVQRVVEAPSLARSQSSGGEATLRPPPMRRSATSQSDIDLPQPTTPTTPEPRLVTPQIAQEFNVLKLDLKLGALSPSELVHSLEKSSIASLLDGTISQSIKHFSALRERIDDTASKVLVTGDLNAGKSTFCNALLRKKVLPEDQQPCTSIFCEVLDARDNASVEEFHAIPINGPAYDRNDESTYDVYPLEKLEEIVVENDRYSQVKIYVEDARSVDQSLLRNGVVDIALIDAPGLNLDSIKTTAVFARQEEIDVVVFVLSAENHFTLSAKEFIWNAAHEKAYIFIVVNRFDNIRDKARCQRLILDQVATLSPRTYQDSKELVHFVSSNAVIDGENTAKCQEFDKLEQSLRRFVLEKRARSKLAPARTYLLNVLGDLEILAEVNKEAISAELSKVRDELNKIAPVFDKSVKACDEVLENVDKSVDDTCTTVYKHARKTITGTISRIGERSPVKYDGIFSAYAFAEATKNAMLEKIQDSVTASEEFARSQTVKGVEEIKCMGVLHLGGDYVEKAFRPEYMFSRKKHLLSKSIKTEINAFDFFDFDKQEKVAGMSLGLTVASVAGGQMFGVSSWVDGLWKATSFLGPKTTKKLIVPAILIAGVAGAVFLISDIPNAVPRKLAKKIKKELDEMDYVHGNSDRITKECRKVLGFPADELRAAFRKSIEKQTTTIEEKKKTEKESEAAFKYFGGLLKDSASQKKNVMGLDLEGPAITL